MKAHGCKRMVFSSSCTVYGEPTYVPLDEAHPLKVGGRAGGAVVFRHVLIFLEGVACGECGNRSSWAGNWAVDADECRLPGSPAPRPPPPPPTPSHPPPTPTHTPHQFTPTPPYARPAPVLNPNP